MQQVWSDWIFIKVRYCIIIYRGRNLYLEEDPSETFKLLSKLHSSVILFADPSYNQQMVIKLYNSPKKAFEFILLCSVFLAGVLLIISNIGAPIWIWCLTIINWEVIEGAYPLYIFGEIIICLKVHERYEPNIKKRNYFHPLSTFGEVRPHEVKLLLGQIAVDEVNSLS